MSFQFRPAIREATSVLVGVAGGTGSGKTFSALRLAVGLARGKPWCVIDTEARRGLHYADQFKFDHLELEPPFSPERYLAAIKEAEKAKYAVIVVDSASHEHAGEGGLLEMHEADLQRMAGDDWKRRDACNMAAWVKPKGEHRKFVGRLIQLRSHLILCMRAEQKVEMVKGDDGKTKIVPKRIMSGFYDWIPICEKNLPFELTASFLLTMDQPGYPKPIKLQEQMKAFFPLDQPLSEKSGELLATWAAGGSAPSAKVDPELAATGYGAVSGVISSVQHKKGTTKGVAWAYYEITLDLPDGGGVAVLKTKDQLRAAKASAFDGTGEVVTAEYRETSKGWALMDIYAADSRKEQAV